MMGMGPSNVFLIERLRKEKKVWNVKLVLKDSSHYGHHVCTPVPSTPFQMKLKKVGGVRGVLPSTFKEGCAWEEGILGP